MTTERTQPWRRRILLTLAALLIVLAGYSTWANLRTYTLTTSIEIDATPSEVWDVLTDLEAYPEWNPFMVASKGELVEGADLTNTMRGANGKDSVFKPELLEVDEDRELRWIGKISPGLIFDGEHSFVLQELEDGRTRLTQSEDFTGVLVPPMQGWLNGDTLPQFKAMNKALAARVAELQ